MTGLIRSEPFHERANYGCSLWQIVAVAKMIAKILKRVQTVTHIVQVSDVSHDFTSTITCSELVAPVHDDDDKLVDHDRQ